MRKIVVLTGAGISKESGIETFRQEDGLWEKHRIEDVATPLGFARNPHLVYDFYNMLRNNLKDPKIKPNKAHLALKELESIPDTKVTIITQNIDNLHERAGSTNIIHMHGELNKASCMNCGYIFNTTCDFDETTRCPRCETCKYLRPHIVWFGEVPYQMDEIEKELNSADLFLCIGTSGVVYPAAAFVQICKNNGHCRTVEFNIEKTKITPYFDEFVKGPATRAVSKYVKKLIEEGF